METQKSTNELAREAYQGMQDEESAQNWGGRAGVVAAIGVGYLTYTFVSPGIVPVVIGVVVGWVVGYVVGHKYFTALRIAFLLAVLVGVALFVNSFVNA